MRGHTFSSLTSVALRQDGHYRVPSRVGNSLLMTAPMLESVSFRCRNTDAIALPWEQVTSLHTCKHFSFPNRVFYDHKLRNLKTWEAGSFDEGCNMFNIPDYTCFEDLATLKLCKSSYMSVGILGYITAPSLVEFSVVDTFLSVGTLVQFLERSSCQLTSFTLCRIDYSPKDIVECLRYMPNLQALSLSEDEEASFMSSILMDHLSSSFKPHETAAPQVSLPLLHDLSLGGTFAEERDAVIPMLKSWAAMPEKLSFEEGRRHFEIHIYDSLEDIDTGFVDELKSMEKEGLRVTIR